MAPSWNRLAVIGCLALASAAAWPCPPSPGAAKPPARWATFRHVAGIIDVAARSDRRLVLSANGDLLRLAARGSARPFASGPGAATAQVSEPYIARAAKRRLRGARCSFGRDELLVLDPAAAAPGVLAVDRRGRTRRLADLPGVYPNGIAFDTVGRFGSRVLVTAAQGKATLVYAVDCRGRVRVVTRRAPTLEGGIAVAPRGFGRYAGDLIAPDEYNGRVYAVDARGHVRTVARPALPNGGDIGVESVGFVPRRLRAGAAAYLADRALPGSPHPGDDALLRLPPSALAHAHVHGGDLLAAGEGGAPTVAIRCRRRCSVRHVADGPAEAHAEGHIVFSALRR